MGVIISIAQYERIERSRADTLAKIEAHWSKMPVTEDLRQAEDEIARETETVRHDPV
jgi:hypothetical protein